MKTLSPVQVGLVGSLDIQTAATHVVQSLVIKVEGAIGVLQQRVRRKHVVVRLHHGSGHLRSRSDGDGQLGLAALVHRQALQQERSKTRATATSSCVKDHESLKTSAVVSQLAKHIHVYPFSRSSTDMYRQRRSTATGAHRELHVSAETAPNRPCRSSHRLPVAALDSVV